MRYAMWAALWMAACDTGSSADGGKGSGDDTLGDTDAADPTDTPDTEDPPADSEEPPADSEEPPVDSEEPPTDTEDPPAETEDPPPDTDAAVDTDAVDTDAAVDTDTAPPPPTREVVRGDVTWHVDFRRAGYADCSYTRHYEGVRDPNTGWASPDGTPAWRADVTLLNGADCLALVTGSRTVQPLEYISFGDGTFWRTYPWMASPTGVATPTATGFVTEEPQEIIGTTVGNGDFRIVGEFELAVEPGPPIEVLAPPASYTCGWPKADPPPWSGRYELAYGEVIPDAVLYDTCSEPVRLHDFAGRYIVFVHAAVDCGPCQLEAPEIPVLEAWAAGLGIDLVVVTILAASLSNEAIPPTLAEQLAWANDFGLTGPVLQDRAYASALQMFTNGRSSFPTVVAVAPDLTILDVVSGTGALSLVQSVIRAHAIP